MQPGATIFTGGQSGLQAVRLTIFRRYVFYSSLRTYCLGYSAKGGWRTNHTEGILLRKDLHVLMDAGKLQIIDGVVSVSVSHPHFQQFNGVRVW